MNTQTPCPSSEELMWAYTQGFTEPLRAHLAECSGCCQEMEEIERLMELGRQLPYDLPSKERLQHVRLEIFTGALAWKSAKVQTKKQARITVSIALTALLVASIALFWILNPFGPSPHQTTAQYRATVLPQGPATFSIESPQPDEVVRLENGIIQVAVEPLQPGERFRIRIGQAQIEVRGTVFEVEAKNGRLISVHVLSGRVVLDREIAATIELGSDEHWPALLAQPVDEPTEPQIVATLDAPEKRPAIVRAKKPVAAPVVPVAKPLPKPVIEPVVSKSAAQQIFQTGWQALKTRDYARAAQSFSQALATDAGDPIAEDAAYWLAVALSYSGRSSEAEQAYLSFLHQFPASPRFGEASVAVGWAVFDRGDLPRARALFLSAKDDRVQKVSDSAKKGLEAIEARLEPRDDTNQ